MKIIDCKPGNSNKLFKKQRRLQELEQNFSQLKKQLFKKHIKKLFTFNITEKKQILAQIDQDKSELDKLESEIFRLREEVYGLEKGLAGEWLVSEQLKQDLSDDYYLLNNFTFVLGASTVEIDHIILGPSGFLLIETKHIGGRMFIEDMAEKWLRTPVNKPEALKNPIKNPQKQLQRNHICFKKLIANSSLKDISVRSVVVFPRNSCILMNRNPDSKIPVLYHDELVDFLSQIENLETEVIEFSQRELVADELVKLTHNEEKNNE